MYRTAPYFFIPCSFFGHDPVILLKIAGFSHPILLFRVGLFITLPVPVSYKTSVERGKLLVGWNAAGQGEEEAKMEREKKKKKGKKK